MKLPQIENRKSKIENHRGTALMAVITMMILVAAAVAAMGSLFSNQIKRTRTAVAGAQLRQLLLAADPAAREELARNAAPHDLTLETPIPAALVKLHIETDGQTATVRTTAHLNDTVATTTATYTHTNGTWSLQSATLAGNL